VWRYSDDVRIGCRNYPEALAGIESLARAARDTGLVLNDQKTAARTFVTYLWKHAGLEIHEPTAEFDPTDIEAAVSSDCSPEDEDEAVEASTIPASIRRDPNAGGNPRHGRA
jgi:hypothetical protein